MRFLYTLIIFLLSNNSFSQEHSIQVSFPKNWVPFGKENVLQTVNERLIIPDSMRKQIRQNTSSSIQLYGYAAPMKKSSAYRPNIQVILRKNSASDTSQLLQEVELNMIHFQTIFKEFSFIDRPHVISLAGRHAIETKFSATVIRESGVKAPFLSRIIILPAGDVFYQISMNDTAEYNCNKEFEELLSSIELK